MPICADGSISAFQGLAVSNSMRLFCRHVFAYGAVQLGPTRATLNCTNHELLAATRHFDESCAALFAKNTGDSREQPSCARCAYALRLCDICLYIRATAHALGDFRMVVVGGVSIESNMWQPTTYFPSQMNT